VPFLFKHAIDGLAEPSLAAVVDPTSSGLLIAAGLTPPALMVAYGVTRIAADGMQQLRNALFAYVTEGAVRQTSLRAFEQLMALDLSFHLNRQTGALSRTVERGSKAVGTVLSMSVSSRGLRDESPSHDVPDLIYLAAEGTSLLLSAWVGAARRAHRLRGRHRVGAAGTPMRAGILRGDTRDHRLLLGLHLWRHAVAHPHPSRSKPGQRHSRLRETKRQTDRHTHTHTQTERERER